MGEKIVHGDIGKFCSLIWGYIISFGIGVIFLTQRYAEVNAEGAEGLAGFG